MLTKDLIACRLSGVRLLPQFLPVSTQPFPLIAERLLELYQSRLGSTRAEIGDAIETIAAQFPRQAKSFQAIRKVVEDLAGFSAPEDADYAAERRALFLASAEAIRDGRLLLPEEQFRAEVADRTRRDFLRKFPQIYADLPDNDRLLKVPDATPREIIERVNMATVQGLLLMAEKLEIAIQEPAVPKIRRLLGRMRFHRLLATVRQTEAAGGSAQRLRLEIDGPASILSQSRSYGMQLALFFPAVCAMERWSMDAKVQWKNRTRSLSLSQEDRLVFHGSTGAYEPPEIQMLVSYFREKAPAGWSISEEFTILPERDGRQIVPDFSFRTPEGKSVHLELFHRWHVSQLLPRLAFLDQAKEPPSLAVGVDKALLANPENAERILASPWFRKHGFPYRDFPTADKLLKALQSF